MHMFGNSMHGLTAQGWDGWQGWQLTPLIACLQPHRSHSKLSSRLCKPCSGSELR